MINNITFSSTAARFSGGRTGSAEQLRSDRFVKRGKEAQKSISLTLNDVRTSRQSNIIPGPVDIGSSSLLVWRPSSHKLKNLIKKALFYNAVRSERETGFHKAMARLHQLPLGLLNTVQVIHCDSESSAKILLKELHEKALTKLPWSLQYVLEKTASKSIPLVYRQDNRILIAHQLKKIENK